MCPASTAWQLIMDGAKHLNGWGLAAPVAVRPAAVMSTAVMLPDNDTLVAVTDEVVDSDANVAPPLLRINDALTSPPDVRPLKATFNTV